MRITTIAIAGALTLLSCGHSQGPSASPPVVSAPSVAISISPSSVTLVPGQTQQFTATVTGSAVATVTWNVDQITGGTSSVGMISSTGLYTAPSQAGSHTVSATSVADQTKSAAAQVAVKLAAAPASDVLTQRYNNARTGWNSAETTLTPQNVNAASFGKIASYPVDGHIYAEPLYVSNLNIPGHGPMDVVFVATEHDSVYAFDATGKSPMPLWQRSFIDPQNGITTVLQSEVGSTISPEIGITSTPAIDRNAEVIYVEALTEESGTFVQRIHALDLATGQEKPGSPAVISATVGGVQFDPKSQLQRASLLLQNGTVYVAFASHSDMGAYHGWVLAYDASTLKQTGAWLDTTAGTQGGIWMSGCGLSADASGNIYAVTSNGTFDATSGGGDYGDSVVKFSPTLGVADYFTPSNQSLLSADDLDLGSSGLMLIPNTVLGAVAGKQGTLYLLDTTDLGKFASSGDSQVVQALPGAIGTGSEDRNFSTPAYFNGFIYYIGQNDSIRQFQLVGGKLNPTPVAVGTQTFGTFGAQPAVSSNGAQQGVLWAIEYLLNGAGGVLHAYNATNVAQEIYNSTQAGPRDTFGVAVRFSVPTVAGGRVYVGAASQLAIFGLLH